MSFLLQERGFWKLNSGLADVNLPDITPWFRTPCQGNSEPGVMSGGLRPPILKFSFQVGDVWFCGFYPALPLNGDPDLGGYVRGRGYVLSSHRPRELVYTTLAVINSWLLHQWTIEGGHSTECITHAGHSIAFNMVLHFVTLWPYPLRFWHNINWLSKTRYELSLWQVWWL